MKRRRQRNITRFLAAFLAVLLVFHYESKPSQAFVVTPAGAALVANTIRVAAVLPTAAGTATTVAAGGISLTAAAPLILLAVVVGGAAGVAWHYWSQGQNAQAQDLAADRYCTVHPTNSVCGGKSVNYYAANSGCSWLNGGTQWNSQYTRIEDLEVPACTYNNYGGIGKMRIYSFDGTFEDVYYLTYFNGPLERRYSETPRTAWADWPEYQRQDTVFNYLTNADIQGILGSSPAGGQVNPGDTINAPEVYIPAQPDDPATPQDETQPERKVSGPIVQPDKPTGPGGDPDGGPPPEPTPPPEPEPSPIPSPIPLPSPSPEPTPPPPPPSPEPEPQPDAGGAIDGGGQGGGNSEPKQAVQWSNHGYKHFPQTNLNWKDIVQSTLRGPAKYKPGINIEQLERMIFQKGANVTNGRPWKVMSFKKVIGAKAGKESRWVRVEISAGTIHGHPITHAEYLKYTK